MTNAEKYKEVFGIEHPNCPTWHCPSCPVFNECHKTHSQYDALKLSERWWNSEYKDNRDKERGVSMTDDTRGTDEPEEMTTTDNTLYNVNDFNDGIVDPTYINGIIDCSDLGIYPWGNS